MELAKFRELRTQQKVTSLNRSRGTLGLTNLEISDDTIVLRNSGN